MLSTQIFWFRFCLPTFGFVSVFVFLLCLSEFPSNWVSCMMYLHRINAYILITPYVVFVQHHSRLFFFLLLFLFVVSYCRFSSLHLKTEKSIHFQRCEYRCMYWWRMKKKKKLVNKWTKYLRFYSLMLSVFFLFAILLVSSILIRAFYHT